VTGGEAARFLAQELSCTALKITKPWNDGFAAAPLSHPQFGTVIGSVTEHLSGCFGALDQALSWWAVVRFAAGQQDG
jgi:hypothetical protein